MYSQPCAHLIACMQSSPYERKDSHAQARTDPVLLATEVCYHHYSCHTIVSTASLGARFASELQTQRLSVVHLSCIQHAGTEAVAKQHVFLNHVLDPAYSLAL